MQENCVFRGHLGLGDNIIQQGIVNKFHKLFDNCYILCRHHNKPSVEHMNSGLPNVKVVSVGDDTEADNWVNTFDGEKIICGHTGEGWHFKPNGFDEVFYEQLSMNISESFNWEARDGDQGEVVLRKLYSERDFCFVHDDPSRGYNINLKTDLPIVRNTIQSQTVFDYLPLLREAKEIHCMDSSFALMIDRSNITQNLFIHRRIREKSGVPTYQKKWNIIKCNL
jgi:hypothetical protein